jgi:TrmH family RNA methyltransferase
MKAPRRITARDNPLLVQLRRGMQDGTSYRRAGRVWIEGGHLCTALRARGKAATHAVVSEAAWGDAEVRELAHWAAEVVVVPATLFDGLSALGSPAGMGFVIALPPAPAIDPWAPSVVLDRVQDAGNVGSILRSAAAFGFSQVLALRGTAGLWSPKVLRAGMGAHFALRLVETLEIDALGALALPLVATSSHGGIPLAQAVLPAPCAWLLGHEGQGVAGALLERSALHVHIPQPGGEESLNVAAAAAICLYASACRDAGGLKQM